MRKTVATSIVAGFLVSLSFANSTCAFAQADVLAKSRLTPEQHALIQEAPITREADGEFGSSTRQAIKKFREAEGSAQTGPLTQDQMSRLRTSNQISPPQNSSNQNDPLSTEEIDTMKQVLAKNWKSSGYKGIVTIRIRLNPDGTLAAQPEVISKSDDPNFTSAAASAIQAVELGQPYRMLKPGSYGAWKHMDLNFDPSSIEEALRLNEQGVKLFKQGKLEEAEPLYKRSLAIREKRLGPDHSDVATSLNNLALLYISRGSYAEAEPLLKRSLAIREKTLGPNNLDVATSLSNLAAFYNNQQRYGDAEPLYKRTLGIRESLLGRDHLDVATSLNNLAKCYDNQGHFAEAEPLYKRSLTIRESRLGPDHPDVATSLASLAGIYKVQGRYAEVEPLLKRSLAIRETKLAPDDLNVATSLNNLALVYGQQSRHAEAEPLLERSLAIRQKRLGPDHPDVMESLNNLAALYDSQGRYGEAEPLFKQSLAIREKRLGLDHPDVATSLNNLASLYEHQGRYKEAEPLFRRSLIIREARLGLDHPDVAASLNNLALLYNYQGRYSEAEPLYKRSLAMGEQSSGPDDLIVATRLNNLALLYYNQSRYAEAEPLYKRSLAIKENRLGPENVGVAISVHNLAMVYRAENRYAEAETLHKRSLATYEKLLGPDHPYVASSLNNLALLNVAQGRYSDAEPLYKNSLAIREKLLGPDHPDVALSLNNLADLYRIQRRYAEALTIVNRTITEKRSSKVVAFPVLRAAQGTQLIEEQQAFTDSYNVLQFSSSSAASEAINKLAQRYAVGTDQLATLVRKDQDLAAESDKLDTMLTSEVSKISNERNLIAEEQIRVRFSEIKQERDKIQNVLNQQFPDYVALSRPQPLTLAETQQFLADDEAVVAFDVGKQNSYVWVVTKSDGYWTEIPTTSKALNDQVQQLRQSLTFNTNKPFDTALAHKIYQQTFGPVAAKFSGKMRLSIVANGALTSIPFSLLITSDPTGMSLKETDWLIKSHAITVLPSIFSLKTMRAQAGVSNASKPMIAFADPVFSKKAHEEAKAQQVALRSLPSMYNGAQIDVRALGELLPPLPGTRGEVQSIAKSLGVGSADLKFGLSATETVVKQTALDQYRVVYFATHGLIAGELEKFSKAKAEPALVLTIPDKPTELDDGLLQASEVAELKLNADWVVLSACNTASSDGVGAEALSGLARAFLYAGARSLVVSHWDVSDDATATLMSDLFDTSMKNPGLSHGEALRVAMLKLLNGAMTDEDAHPRVWAPFVVVGEPAKKM